ncbi:hypothetical protein [cyanobacterium endosymbiont of Rhopalodia gibberula]|uniref:hypothetical protein n=1 Tax=cyanobacterium endosymbiont of Rhopalodia gibberula TaxID=1763363 RepID=UPI001E4401E3|nr:hypothetical protein [cyanobacterium endosymbiont of Rhopalodia gibberula]
MNEILLRVYLSGMVAFLAGLTIFVLFQMVKTSHTENRLSKYQEKLKKKWISSKVL